MYVFLYLLILTGFIFSKGFFSFGGVVLMFLATVLFPLVLWGKYRLKNEIITLPALLILLTVFSLIVYGGLYQQNLVLIIVSYLLLVLNILLTIRLIYRQENKGESERFKIFLFLLSVAVLLRLFMIWSSPSPYIDVFDYLKYGALGFLQGQNPYSMTYTKLYTNFTSNYYGYLPGMLFLTLPFVALTHDPRYTFAASEIIIALLILNFSKNHKSRYIHALLFLNNPVSLYLLEQSYTESLILLLFIFAAWLFVKKKNILMSLILGFAAATKQYVFLTVPVFFLLFKSIRQKLAILCITLVAAFFVILPFYLWNQTDFLSDAVFLQGQFTPRYEGLSFFSLLYRFGFPFNMTVSSVIIGICIIFVYIQKRVDLSKLFYLLSFLFLIFFFFNKWAFINYYYLVAQLLLVGGILGENKK